MPIPLRDFVRALPQRPSPLRMVSQSPSVSTEEAVVDDYIWPTLEVDQSEASSPTVLALIAAPGAMGKSAAARSVAAATNGVYVDLAKMQVGSNTLTGALTRALGGAAYDDFAEALRAGDVTLILDSTDEAQLRAGAENFIEFVRDLAWQLSDGVAKTQVLLFGRSDSIDLTLLALEEVGFAPPVFEIVPLDYPSSCEFIRLHLDRRCDELGIARVHETHAEPFARLRDRTFLDLAKALNGEELSELNLDAGWIRTRDFLGYPPVLTALAERLQVKNPAEELAHLESSAHSSQRQLRGGLLLGIVEQILDRESKKVRDALGERIGIHADEPLRTALYSREEQIARLLQLVDVEGLEVSHPASLDSTDRAQYDELVQGFVRDHPFLRSGRFGSEVFSDYARAWAVSSPVRGAWVVREQDFRATLPDVGPFFTHFLMALATTEPAEIPESQLNDAVRSYRAGSIAPHALVIQHDVEATLYLGDHHDLTPLEFRVTDLSGALELVGPQSSLTVISDAGVILSGGSAGQVDLGPNVTIIVDELVIQASKIAVAGRGRGESTTILSAETVSHPSDLSITVYARGSLAAYFEDPWHQWKPYVVELGQDERVDRATLNQISIAVRRILTSFRPSPGGVLSVSGDKVDRLLVGRNSVSQQTRDVMIQMGVFSRRGAVYELDLGVLASLGVSWNDLHGDDPDRALSGVCRLIIEHGEFRAT